MTLGRIPLKPLLSVLSSFFFRKPEFFNLQDHIDLLKTRIVITVPIFMALLQT